MRQIHLATAATAALALGAGHAAAQTTLTIESWRAEDQAVWDDVLLPAFEAQHPDIDVEFKPTAPTEYNAALNARLDGGTAGDLIVCRPFDGSLALYQKGQLADISDLEGLGNFSDLAKRRLVHRRRLRDLLRADGLGDPRLHLQPRGLRGAGAGGAPHRGGVLRRPRRDPGRRHLHPARDGYRRPLGGGDDGLHQHRPGLLERRGGAPGAHRGERGVHRPASSSSPSRCSRAGRPTWAGASRRRATPTARTCSRWAAPRSIPRARGRSAASTTRPSSRWAPSPRPCPTTGRATSPTTPTSASA